MTKLQTSLANEETWVDGATEKLSALPTATSALELDVSTNFPDMSNHYFFFLSCVSLGLFFIISIHCHSSIQKIKLISPKYIYYLEYFPYN